MILLQYLATPVGGALLLTGMDTMIVLQHTCAVENAVIYNTTAPNEPDPFRTFNRLTATITWIRDVRITF